MTEVPEDTYPFLAAWDIGEVQSIRAAALGTINRTLLVESDAGRFALRCYRHRARPPVEREHAVIAYAVERGVPAVAPIPLRGGSTIAECGGRFAALFPRALGSQPTKDTLSPAMAFQMGSTLARLHTALCNYPCDQAKRRVFAFDAESSLATIDQIVDVIRQLPHPTGTDLQVLERLAARREVILNDSQEVVTLDGLPVQLIHGDYQETNLFFDDDTISSIIDWDQTYLAPRAFEVVRTIDISLRFASVLSQALLQGYRTVVRLDLSELDQVAAYYCTMRLHDLWVEWAFYCEGNQRVGAFLHESGPTFVPLIRRWEELRAAGGCSF